MYISNVLNVSKYSSANGLSVLQVLNPCYMC